MEMEASGLRGLGGPKLDEKQRLLEIPKEGCGAGMRD